MILVCGVFQALFFIYIFFNFYFLLLFFLVLSFLSFYSPFPVTAHGRDLFAGTY